MCIVFAEGDCDRKCRKGYNCIKQQAFCIPEVTCPPTISTCSPAYNQSEPCPYCEDGQVCKLVQVQCIQSPCPPRPQCTIIKGDPDCNECTTGQVCKQSDCETPPCPWKCRRQWIYIHPSMQLELIPFVSFK